VCILQLGRYLAPHKPSSSFFKPLFKAQITRTKQFLKEDNTILLVDELTRKQQRNIREQNSKSRFHQRKYPQSLLVAFLITKDSKLIAFQFKIVHHILPIKSSLFQAGITDHAPLKNKQ